MRYKYLIGKYIYSFLLVVFAATVIAPEGNAADITSSMDLFEPGTTCRNLEEDPRLGVVCGVVRSATPRDVETANGIATHPNAPAKGVSVYIYECEANSPTCKFQGNLTNPFSSTSTDENGYYSLTFRKIGNNQIRYLAFVCDNKLAGLYKVPSFTSFVLNTPLKCPETSTYKAPSQYLDPVAPGSFLSCDIKRPDPLATDSPVSFEGYFGKELQPQVEYNFTLGVDAADSRYMPRGSVFGDGTDSLLNPDKEAPDRGAFYYSDCLLVYKDWPNVNQLCLRPSKETPSDEELSEYEEALYTEPRFTTMNFLPNIPIKSTLLFFKDLTARQDVVSYVQNPTAPAQLLHTIFSNCKGSVYLRKWDDPDKTNTLPDCAELKSCNTASSGYEGDYRNRQYSAGPARNLANPAILRAESEAYLVPGSTLVETEVCTHIGKKIKIKDIQPPWDYCQLGTAGCGYILDKTYWNPEFAYLYGIKGTSMKMGYGFEGLNDTYWAPGASANANQIAFTPGNEKAGIPVKGGTYYSDNNYSLNNGLTPMSGGILSTDLAVSAESDGIKRPLAYVLQRPGETLADKAIYQQGAVKIEDAGSNLLEYCENSNVNPQHTSNLEEFTSASQDTLLINNWFRGNQDHYFQNLIDLLFPDKSAQTATTTIFRTTAGINRTQALEENVATINRFDAYDSLLTTAHGEGMYDAGLGAALYQLALQYLWPGTSETGKSYFDRKSPYPLEDGQRIDDLTVTFDLSEDNFTDIFKLPNDGHVENADWGTNNDNVCYPWNDIGVNGYCYQDFEVKYSVIPKEITRTCKVANCEVFEIGTGCDWCVYEGGDLKFDCYKNSGLVGDCSASDQYDLGAVGPDTYFSEACAKVKIDCMPGPGSALQSCIEDNYELKDIPEATCPTSGYWNVNWSGVYERYPEWDQYDYEMGMLQISCEEGYCNAPSWGDARRCKDQYGDFHEEFEISCTVGVEKETSRAPACNMQDAGPYACSADIDKDSNFKQTQEILRGYEGETYNVDSTVLINNEIWKKLARPGNKTYGTLAFSSADTSVTPAGTDNKNTNRNKDISGFGGASPEYKMISAHALYVNYFTGGEDIYYHCNNSEKGWFGTWTCPLLPVPKPPIIDFATLTSNLETACTLSTNSTCQVKFDDTGNIGALSPAFIGIVNAAADKFKVPAASILTYLSVINKTKIPLYQQLFSLAGQTTLLDGSLPWYGRLPQCDDNNTAAIGPYDWIKTWFDKTIALDSYKNAFVGLSDGRAEIASRCNFLDATFAAAAALTNGGNQCQPWTWDDAFPKIEQLAFGTAGAGSPDEGGDYWAEKRSLWESCYGGTLDRLPE
ncbi:MAG: hypothetical protein UU64_C0004G0048 [candidate division WWE3 bacterium GW2011_GWF2_41_45]|uniref:Uncharacterized protein n=3 Tax=Katanobacteria TaxID=422282 RepID=A0A1F4W1U8_UNCKA|nr:MAG: hypothetical protein UU55_C0007G0034 [candidate division WWE3 bacterium GW2011_GWC2_41_23]KKS10451.1 MAG: hypothetical protein UU64_C0004G0048 [candidate division WWE3 bacterium GW2011_GWF2_41_45]KKS29947.1 MAG: hypothetical protein UU90_C0006G0012 [candidate division WWE3 bacterium GW2011_GWD2_42_11]KKS50712.1 MAG: hypothetical protein UV16_C0007G0080 [candidate division WWE3 bacterium GW2011_GWE2_42_25]KKS63574.1 MAG: hypothetical protein UV31_C0006G0010 [candidate division WWE3 bacte